MKTSMQQLHPHRWLVSAALLVCSLSYLVSGCPPDRVRPEPPKSLSVVAHGNGTFELYWKSTDPSRHNYDYLFVLVWCTGGHPEIPHYCTENIGHKYLLENSTYAKVDLPQYSDVKNMEFAVTANSCGGASDAQWASCMRLYNSSSNYSLIVRGMNVTAKAVASRSIEVGWVLDCFGQEDFVLGYEISYCPLTVPAQLSGPPYFLNTHQIQEVWQAIGPEWFECGELQKIVTVTGANVTNQATISGLEPNSPYKLAVRVLTVGGGQGEFSKPVFKATLEELTRVAVE